LKRITVKPEAKLSLQMHHHRAEHCLEVSVDQNTHFGEDVKRVTENESVNIPNYVTHSLESICEVDLHLIEVKSGSYLGEEDIVRFEDWYGSEELNQNEK
jgi:mannose-6-phosphate isomerase-like protein (cupin superfamily)